eukprot:629694-Prymnesium_polylepis.1
MVAHAMSLLVICLSSGDGLLHVPTSNVRPQIVRMRVTRLSSPAVLSTAWSNVPDAVSISALLLSGSLATRAFASASASAWPAASVRASLALLTLVDFRPTACRQLAESQLALVATSDVAAAVRWAWLVRGKVLGEIAGLGLALRAPLAGAVTVLSSHLLFWLCGAGRSRVGADGQMAPVPPQVARAIATADSVVLAFAALGAFGPTARLRAVGATGFTIAAIIVSAEQLPKLFTKLRELPAVKSFFADVAAKQAKIARG